MNVLTKIILFVLIGGAGVIQAQEQQKPLSWSRYTVKDEEFSVLLPALPAMTTTQAQRHLETSLNGVLYTIDVYQNPQPRQSLDEFIAAMSADLKYDPASERAFTVDGFSGKEFSANNDRYPFIARFVATETRLYRFMVRGPGIEKSAAQEFLTSIKLGNTDGTQVSDGPGDRVYAGKDVDKKVRLLNYPPPEYATDARNGPVGTVILKAVFAKTGQVENITVIRGLPGVTEKCIEAAKKIKFTPAMKDGQKVSMWMQLEYAFSPL